MTIGWAALAFFTWQVGVVPRGALSCADEAAALGARFAAATGAPVVSTACAAERGAGFELSVTYDAVRKVAAAPAVLGLFWSAAGDLTVPGDALAMPPLWGMYGDEAGCVAAIPAQTSAYERETGKTAIVASCARGSVGGTVLRIDGFGFPERRFQQIDPQFEGAADDALVAAVARLLAQEGATIVDQRPWGSYVLVSFYGDPEAGVDVRVPGYSGRVDDHAGCETELAAAKAAVVAAGSPAPALAACLTDSYDGSSRMNLVFTRAGLPTYVQLPGPEFGSYADCRAARVATVASVQSATERKVGGAVCVRAASGAYESWAFAR